ncbi:MAG: alkaline phosphatase family protein, partial [Pseudomonadota bacterium]
PNVETYDQAPKMAASDITNIIAKVVNANSHDVLIVNYANADMVGHTGNFAATVKAIEFLDQQFGKIIELCNLNNVDLVVTADHGNAEAMIDDHGKKITKHSCNPVPFWLYSTMFDAKIYKLCHGGLQDVAPTLLQMLNIAPPKKMTGSSLIVSKPMR